MNHTKVKTFLEVATNVAVLLVALVFLGSFVWHYFAPAEKVGIVSGLSKGAMFSSLPGMNYKDAGQTLILALSSKCDFCTENMPFYKQLIESQRHNQNFTRIVGVFPDTENEIQRYIQEWKLNLETIPDMDFNELNLAATPTLILVDRSGKILDFWIGKPSEEVQQQIIKTISIGAGI